ncbi:YicC family protein, partial [Solemya velum gill symbiont]
DILRWPGVVVPPSRDPEQLQQEVMSLLDETLTQLVETREREGGKLAQMIIERTAGCRQQVQLARERMPVVIEALRTKLHDRLAEIMEEVDSERVEQEIVIAAQKLDVDEEMDRLLTHLDEIDRVLTTGKPIGRRLDFLMQELNREANTLASKSSDKEMTAVAVELKVLIEQMREQIQNIE